MFTRLSCFLIIITCFFITGGGVGDDAVEPSDTPAPKGMVLIPADEYQMGGSLSTMPRLREQQPPVHTVAVNAFFIDKYEVTNAQFQKFVLANPGWGKDRIDKRFHDGDYLNHWNGNDYPSGKADHPVVYVSWYAAMAYAQWVEKRLPMEREWLYAGRGGVAGKNLPWGTIPHASEANYINKVDDTTPVGEYPPNGYGLYDMVGNVWEWCLDEFQAGWYFTFPRENRPSGAISVDWVINNFTFTQTDRILRGGSWCNKPLPLDIFTVDRNGYPPTHTALNVGFRCAKAQFPTNDSAPQYVNTDTLTGHTDRVQSVAFSPEGKTLASGSNDDTVRLWDVATRRPIATLTGHTDDVMAIAFSPNGETLASASVDNTVRLWDVATRRPIATLTGHTNDVLAITFSLDRETLASASVDNTVRLWNIATRQPIVTFTDHMDAVTSVAFSPDGWPLASGHYNSIVRVWDYPVPLSDHTDAVTSVAFSPDGEILASGSYDDTVRLWGVAVRRHIATLTGHTGDVQMVAFDPDGWSLASASLDKTVRLWDTQARQTIAILTHTDAVTSVAFSPDGKTLASASSDNTVRLWQQRQ